MKFIPNRLSFIPLFFPRIRRGMVMGLLLIQFICLAWAFPFIEAKPNHYQQDVTSIQSLPTAWHVSLTKWVLEEEEISSEDNEVEKETHSAFSPCFQSFIRTIACIRMARYSHALEDQVFSRDACGDYLFFLNLRN
jgi:hypothetical protein